MKGENSMGSNFGFNPSWIKKDDVQQPNNYVEITPEMQAEIDRANAEAKAAKNNAALAKGLSGDNKPDLDKGVTLQKSNIPVPTQEQILASQGEIRPADPWIVRTFNNGAYHVKNFVKELGTSIVGGALLVGKGALMSLGVLQSCSSKDDFIPEPLPEVPPKDDGNAKAEVVFLNKDAADYVVNYLNDNDKIVNVNTGEERPIKKETADGIGFNYAYDYDAETDTVKPYIDLGNGFKLYINPVEDLTAKNIVDYINIIGDEFNTADNIDYNFRANGDNAEVVFGDGQNNIALPIDPGRELNGKDVVDYINIIGDEFNTADNIDYNFRANGDNAEVVFGNDQNNITLPIEPKKDLTGNDVVKYINMIGDELVTQDGVTYDFQIADEKAQVAFDNGLIHNVGDDVTLDPNGTTAKLSSMLSSVGLAQPEQNSTKIAMGLETGDGSYGNGTPGFALNILTPANLKDITSGNPTVKGNVADYNFEGKTEQAQAGTLKLEVNGKEISNAQNGIIIKNANGDEVYMQTEQGFDLQSQWDEPGADYNLYDGVVVYVKEAGSDVFKEKYIMSKFDDTHTDIGIIDRENGAIIQNYPSEMTTFDTQGAIDADNYYKEKEGNLNTSYDDATGYYNEKDQNLDSSYDVAKDYYTEKEGNLDDAYKNADETFRYLAQFEAGANADADISY